MVWWGNHDRDSRGRGMIDEAEWAINEFGAAVVATYLIRGPARMTGSACEKGCTDDFHHPLCRR